MTETDTQPVPEGNHYRARGRFARLRGALFVKSFAPLINTVQATRADQFATLPGVSDAIVFLGDSITEGGLWSEWFPQHLTVNRGIGGDTTARILARLDSAIHAPRAVVLLCGTNDLSFNESPAAIAARVETILDEIAARAPECPVLLQGVMPRKKQFATEIVELNRALRRIANVHDGVTYVDLWPALATSEGSLRAQYTNDSLHLNGAGYAAWVDVLRPLLSHFSQAN